MVRRVKRAMKRAMACPRARNVDSKAKAAMAMVKLRTDHWRLASGSARRHAVTVRVTEVSDWV